MPPLSPIELGGGLWPLPPLDPPVYEARGNSTILRHITGSIHPKTKFQTTLHKNPGSRKHLESITISINKKKGFTNRQPRRQRRQPKPPHPGSRLALVGTQWVPTGAVPALPNVRDSSRGLSQSLAGREKWSSAQIAPYLINFSWPKAQTTSTDG